jgi:hypothetical protein
MWMEVTENKEGGQKLAFFDCLLLRPSQAAQKIEPIILRCGPFFGRAHSRSLTKIQIASKL